MPNAYVPFHVVQGNSPGGAASHRLTGFLGQLAENHLVDALRIRFRANVTVAAMGGVAFGGATTLADLATAFGNVQLDDREGLRHLLTFAQMVQYHRDVTGRLPRIAGTVAAGATGNVDAIVMLPSPSWGPALRAEDPDDWAMFSEDVKTLSIAVDGVLADATQTLNSTTIDIWAYMRERKSARPIPRWTRTAPTITQKLQNIGGPFSNLLLQFDAAIGDVTVFDGAKSRLTVTSFADLIEDAVVTRQYADTGDIPPATTAGTFVPVLPQRRLSSQDMNGMNGDAAFTWTGTATSLTAIIDYIRPIGADEGSQLAAQGASPNAKTEARAADSSKVDKKSIGGRVMPWKVVR